MLALVFINADMAGLRLALEVEWFGWFRSIYCSRSSGIGGCAAAYAGVGLAHVAIVYFIFIVNRAII